MVVRMAMSTFDRPLRIHAAMGFGRSYGKESRFLTKKYLGIFQSGIWNALDQEKCISSTAFLTDIGNDLAYEVPVEQLVEWVEACVNRLQSINAKVVLTDVPLNVLRAVGEMRFRLLRTILFPQCRLTWRELFARAERLSERLDELAETRKIPIFSGDSAWYGWDPIHPRRAHLTRIWRELFQRAELVEAQSPTRNKRFLFDWYLRGLCCEKWSSLSISWRAAQPNGRLIDGTKIALY